MVFFIGRCQQLPSTVHEEKTHPEAVPLFKEKILTLNRRSLFQREKNLGQLGKNKNQIFCTRLINFACSKTMEF